MAGRGLPQVWTAGGCGQHPKQATRSSKADLLTFTSTPHTLITPRKTLIKPPTPQLDHLTAATSARHTLFVWPALGVVTPAQPPASLNSTPPRWSHHNKTKAPPRTSFGSAGHQPSIYLAHDGLPHFLRVHFPAHRVRRGPARLDVVVCAQTPPGSGTTHLRPTQRQHWLPP